MQKNFVTLFSLVVAIGCATQPLTAPSAIPTRAPAENFSTLVDDYFAARFAFAPTEASSLGLHEYDRKLDDLSRGSYERRITELHHFVERLETFDRSKLSFDERIDATAIEGAILGELLNLETIGTWKQNPMRYAGLPGSSVGELIKRNFAPPSERLLSVIARLQQAPAVYEAARANVTNPPKEFTDLAIRISGGTSGYLEGTLTDWARQAAGGDPALLGRFLEVSRRAAVATRDFNAWLKNDLLPRSKGSYAIGADNFLAKMKYDEMVRLPLHELLARGEEQLKRDYDLLIRTARQIDPTRSAADVMKSLSDDHPTETDLIPSARRTIEDARRFLIDKDIATIPSEVRPTIEETPPYARSGGFASMDTPGAFETKATEAYYYITPVEQEWDAKHKEEHLRLFNPYVMAMINVHEAFPGHYLQFLYAPRFPTKTRRILTSGTNAEGWAHYSEQMMVDQGFGGADPRYRLAQLQEALLRDCRYVVGIKLHTEGWTVEQGAKFFEEKGFQEPANAYEEARRGAYNPTYLYYTLGKLEIQQLRDDYMQTKGKTLKQFHDVFVAQGALPIPLVRQILMR